MQKKLPVSSYEGDKESLSEAGQRSGIAESDPKAALRAVAAYKVSELIGLGIIPQTVLTQFTNNEGKQRLGQVMATASGSQGQGPAADLTKRVTDPAVKFEITKALALLKNPRATAEQIAKAKQTVQDGFVRAGAEVYAAKDAVYNFDWSNPRLQKDLSTLQLFDLIVGHVDRHPGNYVVSYDPGNKNNIFGVKGIDNDDVFGKKYKNVADQTMLGQGAAKPTDIPMVRNKQISKTPSLPPVVDFETAAKLLRVNWAAIEAELKTYTIAPDEIAATKLRFDAVINHVISLIKSNRVAFEDMRFYRSRLAVLQQLLVARGISDYQVGPATQAMQWGPATMALQNANNSYAGEQQERVQHYSNPVNGVRISEPEYRA